MEVRGKDLKFGIAGMSLLVGPFIGALVQNNASVSNEGMFVVLLVIFILLAINLSNDFLVILWKKHKKFKKHFIFSHMLATLPSLFVPAPYAFILVVPLYIYIGDLAIKSLEEL